MDLDRFKEINDTHGHLVGDHLLVAMAGRLTRVMNGHGLLARYGGDEFVLLVTGELATEALALGERIRHTLAKPFALQNLELAVTVSVGVASAVGPIDPAASSLEPTKRSTPPRVRAETRSEASSISDRTSLTRPAKIDRLAINPQAIAVDTTCVNTLDQPLVLHVIFVPPQWQRPYCWSRS